MLIWRQAQAMAFRFSLDPEWTSMIASLVKG